MDWLVGYWTFFYWFVWNVLTDGPAVVNINLFVRSITTISDIKMVSKETENNVSFYVSVVSKREYEPLDKTSIIDQEIGIFEAWGQRTFSFGR